MTSAAGHGRPSSGHLLVIGGAEDRVGGTDLLRTFIELSGGVRARVVVITTASGVPRTSFAKYSAAFHRMGVPAVRELRLASQEDANDERTLTELNWATGVFFSGGDQSRLAVLVGSRTNLCLGSRLGDKLVIAGTSAGATVMGATMILGGGCDAVGSRLHTGPGLGLLPGVIIDMHFAERRRLPRLLDAVLRQPALLGVGIDEDTAILVSPGRFDVLGRGAVVAVDARATAATGAAHGHDDRACCAVRLHQLYAGDAFDLHRWNPVTAGTGQGSAGKHCE